MHSPLFVSKSESARLDLDDIKIFPTSPSRVDSPTYNLFTSSHHIKNNDIKMIGIALLGAGIFAREGTSVPVSGLTASPPAPEMTHPRHQGEDDHEANIHCRTPPRHPVQPRLLPQGHLLALASLGLGSRVPRRWLPGRLLRQPCHDASQGPRRPPRPRRHPRRLHRAPHPRAARRDSAGARGGEARAEREAGGGGPGGREGAAELV